MQSAASSPNLCRLTTRGVCAVLGESQRLHWNTPEHWCCVLLKLALWMTLCMAAQAKHCRLQGTCGWHARHEHRRPARTPVVFLNTNIRPVPRRLRAG